MEDTVFEPLSPSHSLSWDLPASCLAAMGQWNNDNIKKQMKTALGNL